MTPIELHARDLSRPFCFYCAISLCSVASMFVVESLQLPNVKLPSVAYRLAYVVYAIPMLIDVSARFHCPFPNILICNFFLAGDFVAAVLPSCRRCGLLVRQCSVRRAVVNHRSSHCRRLQTQVPSRPSQAIPAVPFRPRRRWFLAAPDRPTGNTWPRVTDGRVTSLRRQWRDGCIMGRLRVYAWIGREQMHSHDQLDPLNNWPFTHYMHCIPKMKHTKLVLVTSSTLYRFSEFFYW